MSGFQRTYETTLRAKVVGEWREEGRFIDKRASLLREWPSALYPLRKCGVQEVKNQAYQTHPSRNSLFGALRGPYTLKKGRKPGRKEDCFETGFISFPTLIQSSLRKYLFRKFHTEDILTEGVAYHGTQPGPTLL